MPQKWPTKNKDMRLARSVLNNYLVANGGEVKFFSQIETYQENDNIGIALSAWLLDIAEALRDVHGEDNYKPILFRVIDKLFHKLVAQGKIPKESHKLVAHVVKDYLERAYQVDEEVTV